MKHFTDWQVEEAWAYAEAGGQALHTHSLIVDWDVAKRLDCTVQEVRSIEANAVSKLKELMEVA